MGFLLENHKLRRPSRPIAQQSTDLQSASCDVPIKTEVFEGGMNMWQQFRARGDLVGYLAHYAQEHFSAKTKANEQHPATLLLEQGSCIAFQIEYLEMCCLTAWVGEFWRQFSKDAASDGQAPAMHHPFEATPHPQG